MREKELKESEQNEKLAWEALQKVRMAEEKAHQMIEEARNKTSPEIIRKAVEEAEELKKSVLSEARKKAELLKKQILTQAEDEARVLKQQAENDRQAILRKAEENHQVAVRKTVERLLEIISRRKG